MYTLLVISCYHLRSHSASSINFGCCPRQSSMISVPLSFLISRLHMHGGSNHAYLVACLFSAYLSLNNLRVHFIVFGKHPVIAYLDIIDAFTGGYFPVTFLTLCRVLINLIALLSKWFLLLVLRWEVFCLSEAPPIFST